MKITISKKPATKAAPPQKIALTTIAEKLNGLLIPTKPNFFTARDGEIVFGKCANMRWHNKLIAIISLYLADYRSFVRLGYGSCGGGSIHILDTERMAFYNFVCAIPKLDSLNITFEF